MKTKLLVSSLFALFISASVNAQWLQQTTTIPPTVPLSSIHCTDANTCMVVGTTTTIRKTTDGGANWTPQSSVGTANKSFVKMLNKDTIIIGQANCTFKRSTNGGSTWSSDISGGNIAFSAYDVAFLSKTNFTAVGGSASSHATGGHITTSSTNTGLTWPTFVNVSGEPTFFGIEALSATTFVACGGAASVYKTTDGGANWTAKLSGIPITTTLYDIHFPTPLIGYAAGGNASAPSTGGAVYRTIDGGENWLLTPSVGLAPNAIFGIHFVSADTGYAVGDGGKIQVTTTGGATWNTQTSPVTTTLNKIYFPTKNIGYICGAGGVILKTTSGGFIPSITANAGADKSICPGACVTLGSAATGGIPPYTYSWSTGSTTVSITDCPASTISYTVTVTDVTSASAQDSVKVTVYTNPAVSFTGLASNYCNKASSDTLLATPTGGLFSGSGISAGDSVFNAALAGVGTHTVTYTYTTTAGCVVSSSQNTTVLASPSPVPLCLVSVDSTMTNTQNYVVWEKPVTTNIDSFRVYRMKPTAPIFVPVGTVPYSAAGKFIDAGAAVTPKTEPFTYSITTFDTCGMESAKSGSNTCIWLGKPAFILPARFDLNWTGYTGFTVANYEVWRTVDGGINWTKIGTTPSTVMIYTDNPAPSLSARYRIRATKATACNTGSETFKYTLSNVSDDFTGVDEISLNNLLNVFPNPNHGTFRVELSGSGFEVTGTKVYNMLGEVVYQSSEKNKVTEITIPGAVPGIYHLEIRTDSGVANKKITVE